MSKMVVVNDITKSYGTTRALKGVSFEVEKGELFGLIGPDGAGKTSLLRILMSLLLADSGRATMNGFDVQKEYKQVRCHTGYMPGKFSLYPDLTVKENLEFFASVFGSTVEANYHLVKDIYQQIEPFKNRRAGKLSGGMKQKLALSCALIHKPRILILDEPTTGVDAVSRKEFWEMLRRLKEQDITIIVSTPYMDEASLCDRIALIQDGQIFSIDTPQNMTQNFAHQLWAVQSSSSVYRLSHTLNALPHCISINSFGQCLHLVTERGTMTQQDIKNYLHTIGETDAEVEAIAASVEDVFLLFMQTKDLIQ